MALLDLYGSLLIGQYAGMTTALCLTSVIAALDLAGVAPGWRLYFASRLMRVHHLFEAARPKKEGA